MKEAIKSCMLKAPEAYLIPADTDRRQTNNMCLRIDQLGYQCAYDASMGKYARAKCI